MLVGLTAGALILFTAGAAGYFLGKYKLNLNIFAIVAICFLFALGSVFIIRWRYSDLEFLIAGILAFLSILAGYAGGLTGTEVQR